MAYSFNNQYAPNNCPCAGGCPDREVGCHGKCEKYKTWKEDYDRKKKEWSDEHPTDILSRQAVRSIWKRLRKPYSKKHYRDNDFR